MEPTQVFPESAAGGFTRRDGTVVFYTRVNALLQPDWTIVDLGAGRGEWLEDPVRFRRELRQTKGKVRRVIGADIDPVVAHNPSVDEAVVMPSLVTLPLPDAMADMVVADHTLEHVAEPEAWAREVERILKPGGWLVGRTPNRWGYIGVATNLVPNRHHTRVLSRAQPERQVQDVFPTCYELNTSRAQRRYFTPEKWEHYSYSHNPEPAYFGRSSALIRVVDSVSTRLPRNMGATWHVFMRKK